MNSIFNFSALQRITKMMTWCSCPFRLARALAALTVVLWSAGCTDRDAVRVQLHSQTPSGQGVLHLEITAQVAGPQTGLRYKWFSVGGACSPQESDKPTTSFKFADGATRDRVSVEVWRNGKLVGQSSIDVKLDEVQAQLAALEKLPEDLKIEITTVLPYEPKGGPDTRADIAGKVGGKLAPDYSVVLYARQARFGISSRPLTRRTRFTRTTPGRVGRTPVRVMPRCWCGPVSSRSPDWMCCLKSAATWSRAPLSRERRSKDQ